MGNFYDRAILSNLRNAVIAGFVLALVVFLIYLTSGQFNNATCSGRSSCAYCTSSAA